jgi:hypothetical protein
MSVQPRPWPEIPERTAAVNIQVGSLIFGVSGVISWL